MIKFLSLEATTSKLSHTKLHDRKYPQNNASPSKDERKSQVLKMLKCMTMHASSGIRTTDNGEQYEQKKGSNIEWILYTGNELLHPTYKIQLCTCSTMNMHYTNGLYRATGYYLNSGSLLLCCWNTQWSHDHPITNIVYVVSNLCIYRLISKHKATLPCSHLLLRFHQNWVIHRYKCRVFSNDSTLNDGSVEGNGRDRNVNMER